MTNINPVKMLSALALVLLVFTMTDGRIVSKCELKAKLDAAQIQQNTTNGETITVNNLIARLVCEANNTGFNTSFIKAIKEKKPAQPPSHPPPQSSSKAPPQKSTKAPLHTVSKAPPQKSTKAPPRTVAKAAPLPVSKVPPQKSTKAPPRTVAKAAPLPVSKVPPQKSTKAPPQNSSKLPPQSPSSRAPPQAPPSRASRSAPTQAHPKGPTKIPHDPTVPTTVAEPTKHLFGVFQLSDHLACDSGMTPTLNICNISCSALIDDDITNDITCLKTLVNNMNLKPNDNSTNTEISEMLLVNECRSVNPAKLFADCV